ncbi:MAG: helix-turn-helix domain-containing protein [Chitinophagaceae bacterium]|nr:helix-turn-helix domain-containing protein [Chitinophagaceae bacterium]
MENPFEIIIQKLNSIENLLKNIPKVKNEPIPAPVNEVLTFTEATKYINLSKSGLYKKTASRSIPHFKQSKKLYFKRSELDDWMTQYRISTKDELEQKAMEYMTKRFSGNVLKNGWWIFPRKFL